MIFSTDTFLSCSTRITSPSGTVGSAHLSRQASIVAVASLVDKTRRDHRVEPWRPTRSSLCPGHHHWTSSILAADGKPISHPELPNRFVFYPAQTWPHKNHLGLLQAIASLRTRRASRCRVVLSGRRNASAAPIDKLVVELALDDLVTWDRVSSSPKHLRPSIPEPPRLSSRLDSRPRADPFGRRFPLAYQQHAPAVTSLPEQAGACRAAVRAQPSRSDRRRNSFALDR